MTSEFPSSLRPKFGNLPPLLVLRAEEFSSLTDRCGHVMGKSETLGPKGSPDSGMIPIRENEQEPETHTGQRAV